MIVDVHSHLGYDYTFDENFTLEEQLEKIEKNNVEITILQPGTCHNLEDVRKQHNKIAEVTKQYSGKFYGMANPSPHLKENEYRDEIRRCIEDLGFIGIKIHPLAHGVNPLSKNGYRVFEIADEYSIPVMVHTGAGIPFANPSNIIPIAKDFSNLRIILAHCGAMVLASETLITMELCPNVYADTSWTPGFMVKNWSNKIGANRFMLGSDHADNFQTEYTKLTTAGLNNDQLEWILSKTACEVYRLSET